MDRGKSTTHVLIIGAGLGGLSLAIACRREGLKVTILEQSKQMSEIGAGIQLPPNATRIMSHYNLLSHLEGQGQAVCYEHYDAKDWKDGTVLQTRPGRDWANRWFGFPWYVIHRADYQNVLLDEALRLGADLRLDQQVERVECNETEPCAVFKDGNRLEADVIVGADGLSSIVRPSILGHRNVSPDDSGDMAYRATITADQIQDLPDDVKAFYDKTIARTWWGPNSHAVLYPIRHGTIWNMVLICPDDLPKDTARAQADIGEMKAKFQGWDPVLRALVTNVQKCDKWRIRTMAELPTWVKGSVTVLGDACHPTLPYQAQGAAMAVEDGAVLGKLLGMQQHQRSTEATIPEVLKLYESLRKTRTTLNVNGAFENRNLYHMLPEEVVRQRRNEQLAELDWDDFESTFPWSWGRLPYLKDLLGVDVVAGAQAAFAAYPHARSS